MRKLAHSEVSSRACSRVRNRRLHQETPGSRTSSDRWKSQRSHPARHSCIQGCMNRSSWRPNRIPPRGWRTQTRYPQRGRYRQECCGPSKSSSYPPLSPPTETAATATELLRTSCVRSGGDPLLARESAFQKTISALANSSRHRKVKRPSAADRRTAVDRASAGREVDSVRRVSHHSLAHDLTVSLAVDAYGQRAVMVC